MVVKEEPELALLTLRQKTILKLLERYQALTLREITSQLENPPARRTLGDDLANMKRLGLVELTGHAKNARWTLKKPVDSK